MGKETALPKNIRQIGDIRGREKIYMEDYVMTYIRKKEPEEERGYLGIFFGEKKEMEDSNYIFIRGILEIPAEAGEHENSIKSKEKTNDGNKQKNSPIMKSEDNEQLPDAEESEKQETLAEKIQRDRRLYFPDWEIQGCCVIGTYPAAKMEELSAAIPESGNLLYHLQEQEENFYWKKNGQYQRIRGYFVFYEQNKLMQEYMAEVFGNNSVEKETLPDRAIKNFREKITQKSEKKSRSMLKLASSFFVVTVLVIGAIVVNRVDDVRKVQSLSDLTADERAYQAAEVVNSTNAVQTQESINTGAEEVIQQEIEEVSSVQNSQTAVDSGVSLAGAASFWEEAYEDTVSESAGASAAADPLEAATAETADALTSADSVKTTDALETVSAPGTTVDPATTPASDTTADPATTPASDTTADPATIPVSDSTVDSTTIPASDTTADPATIPASDSVVDSTTAPASDTTVDPEAAEAASIRQTYAAYVIKEGDTLADICNRYYGNLNQLEEICAANEIEDANRIMPGQKIVLP